MTNCETEVSGDDQLTRGNLWGKSQSYSNGQTTSLFIYFKVSKLFIKRYREPPWEGKELTEASVFFQPFIIHTKDLLSHKAHTNSCRSTVKNIFLWALSVSWIENHNTERAYDCLKT